MSRSAPRSQRPRSLVWSPASTPGQHNDEVEQAKTSIDPHLEDVSEPRISATLQTELLVPTVHEFQTPLEHVGIS